MNIIVNPIPAHCVIPNADRNGSPQPMFFAAFRPTEDMPESMIKSPTVRTLEDFEIIKAELKEYKKPSVTIEHDESARPESVEVERPQQPERVVVAPGFDEQPRPQVTMMIEAPGAVEGI